MARRKTPIAIFAYKRPTHLSALLKSLEECDRFSEVEPFLFLDAPKSAADERSVEETRSVAKAWSLRHGGNVILRETNWGLSRSVVGGVTELCDAQGRAIVLEDDLLCAKSFLHFVLNGLDHFENDERVVQISGYAYPLSVPKGQSAIYLRYISCWGWGVWKRSWSLYDAAATGAREAVSDPKFAYEFDLGGSYPYSKMMRETLDGQVDSWGIKWQWSVYQSGRLVVYPRESLIWNAGFDGSGASQSNPLFTRQGVVLGTFAQTDRITFPEPHLDPLIVKRLSLELRARNTPSLFQRIGRRVRSYFL